MKDKIFTVLLWATLLIAYFEFFFGDMLTATYFLVSTVLIYLFDRDLTDNK